MRNLRAAAFALLILLTACSRHIPVVTVEVIDTSLSITPRAEKAAFDAVLNQISHLGRGEPSSFTTEVIPPRIRLKFSSVC